MQNKTNILDERPTEAVSPHLPRRLGKAADLTWRKREDEREEEEDGRGGAKKNGEREGRRQVRACASVGGKVTGDD